MTTDSCNDAVRMTVVLTMIETLCQSSTWVTHKNRINSYRLKIAFDADNARNAPNAVMLTTML